MRRITSSRVTRGLLPSFEPQAPNRRALIVAPAWRRGNAPPRALRRRRARQTFRRQEGVKRSGFQNSLRVLQEASLEGLPLVFSLGLRSAGCFTCAVIDELVQSRLPDDLVPWDGKAPRHPDPGSTPAGWSPGQDWDPEDERRNQRVERSAAVPREHEGHVRATHQVPLNLFGNRRGCGRQEVCKQHVELVFARHRLGSEQKLAPLWNGSLGDRLGAARRQSRPIPPSVLHADRFRL